MPDTRRPGLSPLRRERIDRQQLDATRRQGGVVLDGERVRPLWRDGQHLTARDLTREQDYFLGRQSLLGRALGWGVAEGLEVSVGRGGGRGGAGRLRIEPGFGLTPAGETVTVEERQQIDLADIAASEHLNVAFGLRRLPSPSPRSRTGIFVLGLRPVEYTAGPVTTYPTDLAAERRVQDGEVVEATALSLVPYPGRKDGDLTTLDDGAGGGRATLARQLFVEAVPPGLPESFLPLAALALDRGLVVWADRHLVRRELGVGGSLGLPARSLRRSFLAQYRDHLADLLEVLGPGARFAAAERFAALPAAGPLPPATLDRATFAQGFFPAEMEVDLAVVPADEAAVLVVEAAAGPPLDLAGSPEALARIGVTIVAPVERGRFVALERDLAGAGPRPLTAGGLLAVRPSLASAGDLLRDLGARKLAGRRPASSLSLTPLAPPTVTSEDTVWREALEAADGLWYVRRRALPRALADRPSALILGVGGSTEPDGPTDPLGPVGPVDPNGPTDPTDPVDPVEPDGPVDPPPTPLERLRDRLEAMDLLELFDDLRRRSDDRTRAALTDLLSADHVAKSRLLTGSILHRLVDEVKRGQTGDRLLESMVLQAGSAHGERLAEGIEGFAEVGFELEEREDLLFASGVVPELLQLSVRLGPEERTLFAFELLEREELAGSPLLLPAAVRELLGVRSPAGLREATEITVKRYDDTDALLEGLERARELVGALFERPLPWNHFVATGAVPELALLSGLGNVRRLQQTLRGYLETVSRPANSGNLVRFLTNQILRDARQARIDLVRFGS